MKKSKWLLRLLFVGIISVHIVILLRLNFFPYPELFVYTYLTKIGMIPYAQIIDQHFPGIVFFPINLATIGIDSILDYRVFQITLVFINHILICAISLKIFKNCNYSLLVNLLYAIWQPFFEGYVLWIDSFVVPIFLLSLLFLLRVKNKINYLFSGFLLGVGIVFKQVTAPLLILIWIYYLVHENDKKNIIWLSLGMLVPGLLMCLYFISLGVWNDFWYWTVLFNLTIFSELGRKYASFGELARSFFVFGISIFSFFVVYIRKKVTHEILLVLLFTISALMFAYARFDYVHLQPALPFALILIVYTFTLYKRNLFYLFTYIFLSLVIVYQPIKSNIGNKTYFFTEFEQKLAQEVSKYASKNESVFSMATTPHIYYLTGTRPPGDVFVFHFDWFMRVAETTILEGLIKDPPKVILRDRSATVSDRNLVTYMQKIEEYINVRYTMVNQIGNVEILIPNENSN